MVRNGIVSKIIFVPPHFHSIAGITQLVASWFREYGSGSLWRNLIPSVRLASDSRVGGHYIRGEAANKCAFPSFLLYGVHSNHGFAQNNWSGVKNSLKALKGHQYNGFSTYFLDAFSSLCSTPPPLSKPYLPASFQWIGGRRQDGTSKPSILVIKCLDITKFLMNSNINIHLGF